MVILIFVVSVFVVMGILHATTSRGFESFSYALWRTIILWICGALIHLIAYRGLTWLDLFLFSLIFFVITFVFALIKFIRMSDNEFALYRAEQETKAIQYSNSVKRSNNLRKQQRQNRPRCRNCKYYFESSSNDSPYRGLCHVRCRPYTSDEPEEVDPDYSCKFFTHRVES